MNLKEWSESCHIGDTFVLDDGTKIECVSYECCSACFFFFCNNSCLEVRCCDVQRDAGDSVQFEKAKESAEIQIEKGKREMTLTEWTRTCHIGDACRVGGIRIVCVEPKLLRCERCLFFQAKCSTICCNEEERQDRDCVAYAIKLDQKETNVEVVE